MNTDRFKFRVWDIRLQNIFGSGNDFCISENGNMFNVNSSAYEIDNIIKYCSKSDYVIMQCTGLKDKNGKLIYEGDIVKNDIYDFEEEVIFNKKLASFELKSTDGTTEFIHKFWDMLDRIEIVRNIYENTEFTELMKSHE